jgi:hypothetical protein
MRFFDKSPGIASRASALLLAGAIGLPWASFASIPKASAQELPQSKTQNVLQPTILSNGSYTEIYTLTAQHEDQSLVQVRLMVTNIGPGDKNAGCQILSLQPAAKSWQASKRFDNKEWTYADAPNPRLSVGPSRLEILPGMTRVDANLQGGQVKITLTGQPAPIKPRYTDVTAGRKGSKSKFLESEMLIPWSKLETTLNIPGVGIKHLRGYGMLEHSRSVGYPMDFSRGWVVFRGNQSEEGRFMASFRLPPQENAPAVGWIWQASEKRPVPLNGLRIGTESAVIDGKKQDVQVISAMDNSFRITGTQKLLSYSVMDDVHPFIRRIVQALVGNPVTSYYVAKAQLSSGQNPEPGVLELTQVQ